MRKIGFGGLLTIVLITLKLTHIINWNWLIVLLPVVGSFLWWLFLLVIVVLAHTSGKIKVKGGKR